VVPGPNAPLSLQPYLQFLVDDLIPLYDNVQFKCRLHQVVGDYPGVCGVINLQVVAK
jgi:hypothetical protein